MATQWISPTWRMPENSNQSKFENYSLSFDGSGGVITFPTSVDLGLNSSISYWTNFTTPNVFIGENSYGSDYMVYQAGGNTYFRIGNYYSTFAGVAPATGQWNHIVFLRTGNDVEMYLNNVSQGTQTNASWGSTTTKFDAIGGKKSGANDIVGSMSQVVAFDSVLSASQVSALYNSGTPVNPMALTPLPTYYYPLGEGSTGDAADPATTLTVPNDAVPSATVFDFFNTGEIEISEISLTAEFSIGVWINADSFTAGDSLILGYNANNQNKIEFNTGVGILVKNPTTNVTYGGAAWDLNEWQYLLITRDNSDVLSIYRNGVYWGGGSHSGTFLFDRISGFNGSTRHFDGRMSNFQRWNTNLSSAQAETLYNNGVPLLTGTQPEPANLKAWWKMNVDTSTWNGTEWFLFRNKWAKTISTFL
jgi:hypothetical protein